MKLDELYFGVRLHSMSRGSRGEKMQLKTYNLFDFSCIKASIARYRTMSEDRRKEVTDPLFFCFADVWSRCEYEMVICPWPFSKGELVEHNGIKVDLFELYVKPNAKYLMSLVESVDEKDCKKYLKEWREKYKR